MQPTHAARMAAAAALLVATVAGGAGAAPRGSPWGAGYFPNVELTTHEDKLVRFYDDLLKGRAVAINVIYTSCKDACPLETARLVQVQRLLGDRVGKDIFFYSVSIDPARDTPAVLRAYAEKFQVGPGWLFLTGARADVNLIRKKLGLASRDDRLSRDGHQPTLMLGNEATGRWMRTSAVDNPRFLATKIDSFLGNWSQGPSYAGARPLVLAPAEYLFNSMCGACHTIGKGDKVGPDLLRATTRRTRNWLLRYVKAPEALRESGDPIAAALSAEYRVPMPNLDLSDGDVTALVDYMAAESAAQERKGARRPSGDGPSSSAASGWREAR
jgi:protein SCO1/2